MSMGIKHGLSAAQEHEESKITSYKLFSEVHGSRDGIQSGIADDVGRLDTTNCSRESLQGILVEGTSCWKMEASSSVWLMGEEREKSSTHKVFGSTAVGPRSAERANRSRRRPVDFLLTGEEDSVVGR